MSGPFELTVHTARLDYAEFLQSEAERTGNAAIARHARKLNLMSDDAWPAHRAKLLGMHTDPAVQAAVARMARQIVRGR